MTHRGPFQPLPFCDSVNAAIGPNVCQNIWKVFKHLHISEMSSIFSNLHFQASETKHLFCDFLPFAITFSPIPLCSGPKRKICLQIIYWVFFNVSIIKTKQNTSWVSFFFEFQFSQYSVSLLYYLFFTFRFLQLLLWKEVFWEISFPQVLQDPYFYKAKTCIFCTSVRKVKSSNARQLSPVWKKISHPPSITAVVFCSSIFTIHSLDWGRMMADFSINCKKNRHLDIVAPSTMLS